ncbi:MAG: SCO family protein [Hyphomicrobiales bacterium]|nr:SCO family protein [Hyphomicrobiales bacterium]
MTLTGMVLAAALIISKLPTHAATPVTVGGPFTLTAPDGTTVTDETYRGKWLLVFFGYTFCPDACPMTLGEFAGALTELGPDAAKVQPIFITVDPERDTPEVMGQYTEAFDPRIVGLTGTPEQIAAVSQEYGAYSFKHKTGANSEAYLVDHSTYIYIMNPQGDFVQGLDFNTPSNDIADTLRTIMAESGG